MPGIEEESEMVGTEMLEAFSRPAISRPTTLHRPLSPGDAQLQQVMPPRPRAGRNKVMFSGLPDASMGAAVQGAPGAKAPPSHAVPGSLMQAPLGRRVPYIPAPAAYMPFPQRAAIRVCRMESLPEQENAVPSAAILPPQAHCSPWRQLTADSCTLDESKTSVREKVAFAVKQVRPTVLRHILLRNKLVDKYTQMNGLPKSNLVSMIMGSAVATRELLRGAAFQKSDGTHLLLDQTGKTSIANYKRFIEMEPTPRPVSDTFNQTCAAGPGIFARNRFPPGVTTLDRLTWWERQATKIFADYQVSMNRSLDTTGEIPALDGFEDPGRDRFLVMFDDRYQMHKIRQESPQHSKGPVTNGDASKLALEAEAELAQAVVEANKAKDNFSRAQAARSAALSARTHTSFGRGDQRFGVRSARTPHTALRLCTAESHGAVSRGDRAFSALGPGIKDDTSIRGAGCGRPGTEAEFAPRAGSASLDPEAMRARSLSSSWDGHDRSTSPLRYRAKAHLAQGSVSPSRLSIGGELLSEWGLKNTFAMAAAEGRKQFAEKGGHADRNLSLRAGQAYKDSTLDHVKTLMAADAPRDADRRTAGTDRGTKLSAHLLALKNLGTRRWRKAYERGTTDFVPNASALSDYWLSGNAGKFSLDVGGGQTPSRSMDNSSPLPPPIVEKRKSSSPSKMVVGARSKAPPMHLIGEQAARRTEAYNFGSAVHPKTDMVFTM